MPKEIIVARAEPGRQAHFPDVVRLADGRLLATYRESAGHVRSDGRLMLVESADRGQTWGPPRVAVDGPYDDRDPKLAVLADGTVLLSYFVIDWSSEPRHTTHGAYVRRSTDGGRTWGEPAQAGRPGAGAADRDPGGDLSYSASHGSAVELPGGDLLQPLYLRLPGHTWGRASVARSTDGGRSWPAEDEVLLPGAAGVHLQEPHLIVLDDEVVALIRATDRHAYLSRSADGGRSWSTPLRTDMPASSHHALVLGTGEVLVTYGDLSSRFSPLRDTLGRLVRRPRDPWDGYPDVPIYDSGHPDQANPSSVEVAPGRFLTLGFDVPAATVVGVFTDADDYPEADRCPAAPIVRT